MQGIYDSGNKCRFVSIGFPASVGNPIVFSESSFFKTPNSFFSQPDEYILADKAYRVPRCCMTPYKEPLASQEVGGYKSFNIQLAEVRIKVKHVFGVLKIGGAHYRDFLFIYHPQMITYELCISIRLYCIT